jgi:hypothetical protein
MQNTQKEENEAPDHFSDVPDLGRINVWEQALIPSRQKHYRIRMEGQCQQNWFSVELIHLDSR